MLLSIETKPNPPKLNLFKIIVNIDFYITGLLNWRRLKIIQDGLTIH